MRFKGSSTYQRWHRVREWSPGVGGLIAQDVVGPPLLLERPCSKNQYRARLHPVIGDEWWRDRQGIAHEVKHIEQGRELLQAIHRGAIIAKSSIPLAVQRAMVSALGAAALFAGDPGGVILGAMSGYTTRSNSQFIGMLGVGTTDVTQLCDALMVYGTSGDAVAYRLMGNGKTLESMYWYISAQAITTALALSARIRGVTSGKPSNSITEALTGLTNGSLSGWNNYGTFTSALTQGTIFFVCLEDGTATDNVTVLVSSDRVTIATGFDLSNPPRWWQVAQTTTTGYTTSTFSTTLPLAVAVFTDGTALGNPISTSSQPSETQKGIYWKGGPTVATKIYGVTMSNGITAANMSAGQIFTGSNGPTGTAQDESTFFFDTSPASLTVRAWATSGITYTIAAGVDHRIVSKRSAASTEGCKQNAIGTFRTGDVEELKLTLPYGGNWQWTDETSSAWANNAEAYAAMQVLIDDNVATSGGGSNRVYGS